MNSILIVDDEMYIRKILEINLKKAGYEITLVEDVYEAEELLEEGETFDLIITDLMLPVRDGFDLVRTIRDKLSMDKQKIIIISAKGMDKDVQAAAEYNVVEYIQKPFGVQELVKKIDLILKKGL